MVMRGVVLLLALCLLMCDQIAGIQEHQLADDAGHDTGASGDAGPDLDGDLRHD
jgi:hypothetical protein